MAQKLYFLALDNHLPTSYYSLWTTDGTTTTEIGGIGNAGVAGSGNQGLQPTFLTPLGYSVIFAGVDSSGRDNTNVWVSDGTPAGTQEVGGTTAGQNSSALPDGNPNDLAPDDFVSFGYGSKALFYAINASNKTSLWVTDGSLNGTKEVGGFDNGQVLGRAAIWQPTNLTALGGQVIFNARDSDNYIGIWTTDGNTATEIGGLDNAGIVNASTGSSFGAHDFTALGNLMLFAATDAGNQSNTLWVTDGTASGTMEIGGAGNGGVTGASHNASLGAGLASSVRFGNRLFFQGYDDNGSAGLWVTDGTASGTFEVGGLSNGGVTGAYGGGLHPTDLTVNGQTVLFNGWDHTGKQALWATDGTAAGTYEIGGGAVTATGQSSLGLNPREIVALGDGSAVFIGDDNTNGTGTVKPTLWVTNGVSTHEVTTGAALNNQSVVGVNASGFNFNPASLFGGDGHAYFVGQNAAGNFVLWQTDGTVGGTKQVTAAGAPATGLHPTEMVMANVPQSEAAISGGGKTIDLSTIPNADLTISNTNNVADVINGSNGSLTMQFAQAAAYGGGLLISLLSSAVDLYSTNGSRDTVSFKGAGNTVTLHGAQTNVVGGGQTISFAPGTTGNYVYIKNTNGNPDTVNGANGTIDLDTAQVIVNGGPDNINFVAGTGNVATLQNTAGAWDVVHGFNGAVGTVNLSSAYAQVYGGGETVNFSGGAGNAAQLLNTGGVWDKVGSVGGAKGTVYLTNALAQISGGGQTVNFWGGTGNVAQLLNTGGGWDAVKAASGSSGTVLLTSALAQVYGGGETVKFWGGSGNTAQLLNTAGVWDYVSAAPGSKGTVLLTSAWAQITGGGDTVSFWGGTDNKAQLVNTGGNWDIVNAAANSSGTTYLTSAQAQINGGGETAYFWGGSGNLLHLANTGTKWDIVNAAAGSTGTVFLTSAWAQVNGGGDNIQFLGGTNNAVHLANTGGVWDGVTAANGVTGTIHLTSAQTQVTGGGFAINFLGGSGNQVSLVNTGVTPDTVTNVNGVTGTVFLTNARATITGSGDTVNFYAGTNNQATVSGSNEAFVFAKAAFGLDTISGFNASDSLSFNIANQGHLSVSQSAGNTLITLDGSDAVTLTGYTGAVSLNYHS